MWLKPIVAVFSNEVVPNIILNPDLTSGHVYFSIYFLSINDILNFGSSLLTAGKSGMTVLIQPRGNLNS